MNDELKHSTTISKKDQSFPDYLDFDKLRSEGIDYLGKLAGQIWTDHNVHDPGITILEMLCYALLDLGYRTQLPVEDILARDPGNTSEDNNFFSPAEILACNPLTITDFRKLLIDIKDVRNAWLVPATDINNICRSRDQVSSREDCVTYLNGIYHVYLDLEKNIGNIEGVQSDFSSKEDAQEYKDDVIERVKHQLMAHRNFCEDFADINILCKQPIGVCAEIELKDNSKVDDVYIRLVEHLRDFFTSAPKFYTLQQLLDKQKSIEEIFSGRPYNLDQSHGFVDTEEFEALKLKKEIHTSDIYNVVFNVPGVDSIRNLSIRTCDDSAVTSGWKFKIKENHILEFSANCSGFRFTRNGMPVSIDVNKYQSLFDLKFSNSGKVLYKSPSPYLNAEIPNGDYRRDLKDYFSIQNEFPRVYSIQDGGLTDNATDERKAQALQLKGYLLFFDQLLANYLAQLGNIRSLFALDSPTNEADQHTYFMNQLDTVPELQKLLRFPATGKEDNGVAIEKGDTLVFPISKQKLLDLLENDELKNFNLEQESSYVFDTQNERDVEVHQIINDMFNEVIDCKYVKKTDSCVFYYILTSSDKVALISKSHFKDIDQAKSDAASVKYIGTFDENYRKFVDSNQSFSFTIDMNLNSFADYLQLLMEDRTLYLERRQDFLQHLLARFSESFTDYALLSFGNTSNEEIEESKIKATERFLTNYDDISSNRGKAFDYHADGWSNSNISGFEKRVRALIGIDNWGRNSLCNFEVSHYDDQYISRLEIEGKDFFRIHNLYDSPEEAMQATRELFNVLSDKNKYVVQPVTREDRYKIVIQENGQSLATYRDTFGSIEEAQTEIKHLNRLFSGNQATSHNIFASDFIYFLQLKDYKSDLVHTSAQSYDSEAVAKSVLVQIKQGINDKDRWQPIDDVTEETGTLFRIPSKPQSPRFIDLDVFRIDIDDMPAGDTGKFNYDLFDIYNRFHFRSGADFESLKQAREHWQRLLTWMTNVENYTIRSDSDKEKVTIVIEVDGDDKAIFQEIFDNEEDARIAKNEILSIIRQNVYSLSIQKVPHMWKFGFRLGVKDDLPLKFESLDEYETEDKALAGATGFQKSIPTLQVKKYSAENEFRLVPIKPPEKTSSVRLIRELDDANDDSIRELLNNELSLQQEVNRLLYERSEESFSAGVEQDYLSKQGPYVYRLVDKDNIPACYSEMFPERGDAEHRVKDLRKLNCDSYSPFEICMGGSAIINERINRNAGTSWYHYLVRSRNRFGNAEKGFMLFESVKGYRTVEEAEEAFRSNYLMILELASHSENYGRYISFEEVLLHDQANYTEDEAIVFVSLLPREEEREDATKRLMQMANSFPIRVISEGSDSFYSLFNCEEKQIHQEEKFCKPSLETYVYYFRLYHSAPDGDGEENRYWRSSNYFSTPKEARSRYRFFRMLLCYPGNYFVYCDPCSDEGNQYQICLREVLAESTKRFDSAEAAWGKDGVQKLICVSQTERAFHPVWREKDDCFSFYMACFGSVIYHPCHYDTPKLRDEAIVKLYDEYVDNNKKSVWQFKEIEDDLSSEIEYGTYLLDGEGKSFAITTSNDYEEGCEVWLNFFSKVLDGTINYKTDENDVLVAYDNETYENEKSCLEVKNYQNLSDEEWKKKLQSFACLYPIVKRHDEKTGKEVYCIELKLPGFSLCVQDMAMDSKPCGCGRHENDDESDCYIAWKSKCCFNSCEKAFASLEAIKQLLMNRENYRPIFDCECYDFSIALHSSNLDGPRTIVASNSEVVLSSSEVIAQNPQCYANPDEVCASIDRTMKLINAEGFHVAEHILLRPRFDEDCNCDSYKSYCENKTDCYDFTWSEQDDDPCADMKDVSFIPGGDPYSFIATVALPAWPLRFRNEDNRRLIEHILYREAPAHVLLRILWLAPHDYCCFEEKYKLWSRWLAQKKTCIDDFSNCDFLEFLFDRNYECLDECDICECEKRETKLETDFCIETWSEEAMGNPFEFLNQVNKMYCWNEQQCYDYQFTPCDSDIISRDDNVRDIEILSHRSTIDREYESGVTEKEIVLEEAEEKPLKPKAQVVNSRMSRYRSAVGNVLRETNRHMLAEKTRALLSDPHPNQKRTSDLLEEIVKNEEAEDGISLTESQVDVLVKNVICYYLDKVCFNGKDSENIEAISKSLHSIPKTDSSLKLNSIFDYWEPEQVKIYEPNLDIDSISQIFKDAKG